MQMNKDINDEFDSNFQRQEENCSFLQGGKRDVKVDAQL